MLPKDRIIEKQYSQLMAVIKQLSQEKREIAGNESYIKGKKIEKFKSLNTLDKIKKIILNLQKKVYDRKCKKQFEYPDLNTAENDRNVCNYVSKERIAVYTCITGGYDSLQEPLIKPDNIDYYAFTDFEIPEDSKWSRIPIEKYEGIRSFSPVLINRYFKMHPHLLFPQYTYSIYVDGSIRIYSDLTEHVNRISKYGFSCFRHSKRKCAYEEAKFCNYLGKEKSENIENYCKRLKELGLPTDYGVLACGFLVRKHNEDICIKIMEQWWNEFKNCLKRDQVSLPLVLFMEGISTDEICTLGGSLHKEYSVEIIPHIKV